jgi:hypothetical protein
VRATGEFMVSLGPLDPFTKGSAGVRLDRLSITKTFEGDLLAESRGEMLSVTTNAEDSAGYVAVEQIQGTLQGKTGTFVLQHFGIIHRGQQRLVLEVVPDSGTGELEHLTGNMSIKIENGKHFYDFEYSIEGELHNK